MTNTMKTAIADLRKRATIHKDSFINAQSVAERITEMVTDNFQVAKDVLEIAGILGFDSNDCISQSLTNAGVMYAWTENGSTLVFKQVLDSSTEYELAIYYFKSHVSHITFRETSSLTGNEPREILYFRCISYADIYRESESVNYTDRWYDSSTADRREFVSHVENLVSCINSQITSLLEDFKQTVEARFHDAGID